jgi:sortase A
MVLEGVDPGTLRVAAGHIPGTAFPGFDGNVGIAAHRDTFFRPLSKIQTNDRIEVTTLNKTLAYRVLSTKIVNPDDNEVLRSTGSDTLTLVTCYPFYYIGPAPKRFIVTAQKE